jgi:hypothetical protein
MRFEIVVTLLLLGSLLVWTPAIEADEEWIIDGDTVYVDNDKVYASATPHTITKSQWVEFELKSKVYSGDIDVAWGFDTTKIRPHNPQRWNGTDWVPFNKEYKHVEWSKFGMTDWYVVEDVNINQNQLYKLRMKLRAKNCAEGKYWFAFKPSSEGWLEAYNNNHIYYLDPWYGNISSPFVDEWEFNATHGVNFGTDTLVHLGSTFYMYVFQGDDNDGYLQTFNISSSIYKSVVDEWEFEDFDIDVASLEHVSGDIYALAYDNSTSTEVFTFRAWDNGTIRPVKIDSITITNESEHPIEFFSIGSNDNFGIAYDSTNGNYLLDIVKIFSNGTMTLKDSVVLDNGTHAFSPYIFALPVDTDTVLTYYAEDDLFIDFKTYNISVNGKISLSDTRTTATRGTRGHITELGSNSFALLYSGSGNDGFISTFNVSDQGTISSFIDTYEFLPSNTLYYPMITHIAGRAYAITVRDKDGDGRIYSINITDGGTIAPSIGDTWEFDNSDNAHWCPMTQVGYATWLLVYETTDGHGYMGTLNITTNFPSSIVFTEAIIDNNAATADEATGVDIGDVNGDGYIDVVMIEKDVISWYKNDGSESFTQTTIDASFGTSGEGEVLLVDIDKDSDLDILASRHASHFSVYYNNGSVTNPGFTEVNLNNYWDGAHGMSYGDIDNDGDLDIACTVTTDDDILWYRNLGGGSWSGWNRPDTNFNGGRDTALADFDNDGLMDIVAVSLYDGFHWYENATGSFTEHGLASGDGELTSMVLIDMDGDGYNDTLTTSQSTGNIIYYKHNGSTTNPGVDKHIIGNVSLCQDLKVEDIDSDGDYDVVVCGKDPGAPTRDSVLSWFENDGSEVFTEHVIRTIIYDQNYHLAVSDIDGDSLPDIALTAYGNDTLTWFKQGGDLMNNPGPSNGATGIDLNTPLNVTITPFSTVPITITFRTNVSGSWADINTIYAFSEGSYSTATSDFDNFSTTYFWSVNVTDGSLWENDTLSFTTKDIPIPISISCINTSRSWINISWTQPPHVETVSLEANNLPDYAQGAGIYGVLQNSSTNWYNWTSLADGITFYFQAWSYDDDTKSFSSNNASVTGTTRANIFNFTQVIPVNETTTSTVRLAFTVTCGGAPPGGGDVVWWYKKSADAGWINNGTSSFISGIKTSYTFSGLDPNTDYDFCGNYTFTYGACSGSDGKAFVNDTDTGDIGVSPNSVNRTIGVAWRAYDGDPTDTVNVTILSNITGSWQEIVNYTNVDCSDTTGLFWGEVFTAYIGPVSNAQTYWWRVLANDSHGDEMNHTFRFYTSYNWAPDRNYTLWSLSTDHYPQGTHSGLTVPFTQYIEDINNATCRLMIRIENATGWHTISDTYVTNSSTPLGMGVIGVTHTFATPGLKRWSMNATDNISWTNYTYAFTLSAGGGGGGAPTDDDDVATDDDWWINTTNAKVGASGVLFGDDLYIPWWIVGIFFAVVIVLSLTRKKRIFVIRK